MSVVEFVKSKSRLSEVHRNRQKAGFEIDVIAMEFNAGALGRVVWLFEVKSAKVIARDMVKELAQEATMMDASFDRPRQFVLVGAGTSSQAAMKAPVTHGIEIWDSYRLPYERPVDVALSFFGERIESKSDVLVAPQTPAAAFEELLRGIPSGPPTAAQFQDSAA